MITNSDRSDSRHYAPTAHVPFPGGSVRHRITDLCRHCGRRWRAVHSRATALGGRPARFTTDGKARTVTGRRRTGSCDPAPGIRTRRERPSRVEPTRLRQAGLPRELAAHGAAGGPREDLAATSPARGGRCEAGPADPAVPRGHAAIQ